MSEVLRLDQLTTTPLTHGEARSIEEAIVRDVGQNLRHEISPNHAWYQQALVWGEQWLTINGSPR